jgi:hypothetical protein
MTDAHFQILGTGFWPLNAPTTPFLAPPEIVRTVVSLDFALAKLPQPCQLAAVVLIKVKFLEQLGGPDPDTGNWLLAPQRSDHTIPCPTGDRQDRRAVPEMCRALWCF